MKKSLRLGFAACATLLLSVFAAQAQTNNSLRFDGAGDYVAIGSMTAGMSYTKEAWVYSEISGTQNILSSNRAPFWITGNTLAAGHGSAYTVVTSTGFPLNKWVHVAVSFDASNNTLRLYRDGVLVSTNTTTPSQADPMFIGSHTGNNSFTGRIDNVRFWNTVRTAAQINQGRVSDIATAPGLIASYNFNQGIANGNNTTITQLIDQTGNTNGNLVGFSKTGNTSNFVEGIEIPNNALSLNGNQYMTIAGGVNLSNNFSQEAWIYPSAIDHNYHGFLGTNTAIAAQRGPSMYYYNQGTGLHGGFGDGNGFYYYMAPDVIKPNTWNHVAQTFDGTTLKLYVNGQEIPSSSFATYIDPAGKVPIDNGKVTDIGDQYNPFFGKIDEVRLWSSVRTAQEIKANYGATVPLSTPNLQAYYNFNQGDANQNNLGVNTLYDIKNNHDVALNSFSLTAGSTSNWVSSYAAVVPVANSATGIGHDGFTANWIAPTTGTVASYQIEYATNTEFTHDYGTATSVSTSISLSNLKPAIDYYYRIRAVDNNLEIGGASNIIAVPMVALAAPGHSLSFDGGQYLTITNGVTLTQNFTQEAWIYSTATDNNYHGFLGNNNVPAAQRGPGMYVYNNGTGLHGGFGDGTSFYYYMAPNVIKPNTWNHVAQSFDGTTLKLFVNGLEIPNSSFDSYVDPAGKIPYDQGRVATVGDATNMFQGSVDEVRLWSVVRTPQEIRDNYRQIISSNTIGLRAYYNFDQGNANQNNTNVTVLRDQTNNKFDATLNNFSLTAGSNSNWVSSYALVVPTATSATISPSGIRMNWSAPSYGTAATYELDYSPSATFASSVTIQTGIAATNYTITNLKPGSTYYYRVRAVSSTGEVGGNSNAVSATTTILSPPGNALAFDNGQLVDLGAGVQLGTNFTEEVWINSIATDGAYHAIMGSGDNNGLNRGPSLYVYNGVSLHGGFGTGANWINYEATNVLKPNAWNHIAQTFDGNSLKLYVNGEEVSLTISGNPVGAVPTNNGLVNRLGYIDNHFQGRMDEVRLWSVTRSAQEIKANYNQIVDPNTVGLVAYYNFDQGNANQNNAGITTLYDQTANGHNGSLSNFALDLTAANWVDSYAIIIPSATTATNITNAGLTANWDAPVSGTVTSYVLEYSPNATFQSNVASATVNATNFTVTGLNPRMTYYYRVRAVNGTVIGGASNSIPVSTFALTPPGNALDFRSPNLVTLASTQTIQGAFTVSLWAKPANTSGNMGIFSSRLQNGNSFDIQLSGGNRIHGDIGDGSNWLVTNADAPIRYQANQWIHLTYVVDPTGYKIFANGDLVGQGNFSGTPKLVDAGNFFELGFNGYDYFNGALDEVKIYNTALTDAEVKADVLEFGSVKPSHLVAHYDFDQGIPQGNNSIVNTLYNQSNTGGYQGTLTNNFGLNGMTSNWIGSYALTVPTALTVTNITTDSFTANWAAPASGTVDGYRFEYSLDPTFVQNTNTVELGNVNSYALTGLPFNTSYYVRVSAKNSVTSEIGIFTGAVSATTNAIIPTTNALHFDGVNDYVSFDQKPITIAGQSWTIEGWIKTADVAQGIFGINDGNTAWDYGEKQFYINAQGLPTFVGYSSDYIRSTKAINDDKWHHVAVTADANNNIWNIFVDGVSSYDGASGYHNSVADLGLPNFGKPNYFSGEAPNYFKGTLDQFRFWNKALSQAEIVDGLTKSTPSNTTGLLASYNFSQGTANGDNTTILSVKDELNAAKGTLTNFAKTGTGSNFVGLNNYPMEVATATAASSVSTNSFVANWNPTTAISATTYELDVAIDANFATILPAYNSTNTGNVTNFTVSGLTAGSTYYYRVRANSEYFGTATNSNSITVTGDKIDQTITLALMTNTVVYGDADYALGASSSNNGIPLVYSSSDPTVVTVSASGTVQILQAGSVTITVTQAGDAQYNAAATVTQNLTISPKALVLTANGVDKVYDGTTAATATISVSGTVNGDVITASAATATFNNKTVAVNKPVSVSGITITGPMADSYSFATTSSTAASITTKSLTLTASAPNKVYDGTAAATATLGVNGTITGDLVSASATTATFTDPTVGASKTVTIIGISLAGTDAANYSYAGSVSTTAAITARSLVVSAAANTKIYDGSASATVNLSDNRIAGSAVTITFTAATFNDKHVAIGKTVTVSGIAISGIDAANYMVNTTATTTANITARALTISASASDKVYDGTSAAAASLTDNRVSGDVLSASFATASFNNANVGTGKAVSIGGITITGADVNNYTINSTASATASITPKALTITADNKSRLQGVANPTLTVSYAGFITGQNNSNALSAQPNITTTANVASLPGNYPITASGAVATGGNYAISYVGGTLTVNLAAVTSVGLAATSLFENRPAGTVAGTLSSTSTDPAATFTYTLVTGTGSTDNSRFTISGNQVLTAGPLDFEAQSGYAIRVRSTTQFGLTLEQTFTVNVQDVNEAPTLDAVANQTVCYTTAVQQIALTGITPGPEANQALAMTIATNNPGLFRSLSITKGNGTAGTFSYGISNGWSGTAIVTVTLKDDGGTANNGNDTYTRTFNITVNPLPVVTIWSSSGSNSISKGETISLKADAPGAASYSWSNANGILSGQNTATLTIRPTQTTTYTVTALNATGCSESKQLTIEVRSDFFAVKANNILTPNGDGANDTWIITNIDQYPNAEVKVFDRAGRIVFSKKGYDNSWNGSFNGTPLNEGAYLYVIDFGPGLYKAKGTVTILQSR